MHFPFFGASANNHQCELSQSYGSGCTTQLIAINQFNDDVENYTFLWHSELQ
jgi:hypothetical protein